MNQKGFFLPPLGIQSYAIIGLALALGLMGIALKLQISRLNACKAEFKAFQAQVEVLGKQAEENARKRDLETKQAKEKADHENTVLRTKLADTAKRLRDTSTRSSYLSQVPPSAGNPETTCFDRAKLDAAFRDFRAGISELAIEGEQATIDLDTAKKWAQGLD